MCDISFDGEYASVCVERDRRAKKPHRCEGCNAVILPGEVYCYISGVSDRRGFSERGCRDCAKTREAFGKDHHYAPSMDQLRETLRDCIAEGDPESLRWKVDLDALDARMEAAAVKRCVTKILVAFFERRSS